MTMSIHLRRTGPMLVTAIFGIIIMLAYPFTRATPIGSFLNVWSTNFRTWITVLLNWAVFLGTGILLRIHGTYILRKQPNQWIYSVVIIVTFAIFTIIGAFGGSNNNYMKWIQAASYQPVSTAIQSIEAFWVISAMYYALRAKNLDSTLLMVAGVLILMMSAPLFNYLLPGIYPLGEWIMAVPNTAGQRAMTIGIGFGMIALGVRTLMGREKGAVSGV